MSGEAVSGVAIVGPGRMGEAHARAWAALAPDVEVVAVVGRPTARALPAVPEARLVTDLETVLADPGVTILSVCTPTDTHLELASRALAAGKHVLLEKPLTRTAAEGEELVRASERAAGVLMVAQVVRFFPGYVAVRDLVTRGDLGALHEVRVQRLSATGGRPAWVDDDERSGGVLLDLAVHDFDQLLLLLGPARRVEAVARDDGTVEVTVDHAGGATGRLRAGWDLPADFPFSTLLEVTGIDGRARHTAVAGSPATNDLEVEGPHGVRRSAVDGEDPYTAQARYFLDCVRTGRRPEHGDPAASLAALRLALAARTSLLERRSVDVD
ncbi:MAG TPA: Gfo/Idh/MocA family oxidoreductase [Amnibacterium sp.]|nr:Gfo/Idh/MocA family oxidoreductase [Amnibacterium sp.]